MVSTLLTGMSLVSYYLAKNPDVQEHLFLEVMDAIQENGDDQNLDYNVIQSLPYLDQVMMQIEKFQH